MAKPTLDSRAGEISDQLQTSLGVHGASLEKRAAKAGRALPKSVRRDIDVISNAQALQDNPKLARQIDEREVEKAHRHAKGWLGTVDRAERRKTIALNTLTEIAFRILVVAGLFLAILIWRDLI